MVKVIICVRSQMGRSEEYLAANHRRMCEGRIFGDILWPDQQEIPTRGVTGPELDVENSA